MLPTDFYNFNLSPERIAQRPVYPYHDAKLMVLDRQRSTLSDKIFLDLPSYFNPNDILVFNNTRVIPARFFGMSANKQREVEILLVEQLTSDTWCCMGKPLKKLSIGDRIDFNLGLFAIVEERISNFEIKVRFVLEDQKRDLKDVMWKIGLMPIPPYIRGGRSDQEDRIDYQTIFAKQEGSIAAPTASLHFTSELLDRIKTIGCKIEYLTLHVGSASFLPLWNEGENLTEIRQPSAERYQFTPALISKISHQKKLGGRCIAIGTTVVRALETMVDIKEDLADKIDTFLETNLFIKPGHVFKVVDALVTNFHQPKSTHLSLVEAFVGIKMLEQSYQRALLTNYSFLSYGDGMLII